MPIYVSTTLRHFQTELEDFYSRDFELCGIVYRRLDLLYFSYLWRAFRCARSAYLEDKILDPIWIETRSRWQDVIFLGFEEFNLYDWTEEQLAGLLETPTPDDPYDSPPKRVNIFNAPPLTVAAWPKEPRCAQKEKASGQSAASEAEGKGGADHQTQEGLLFEEGII